MNAERIFGAFLFAEDWQPWSPSEASSQFDVLAARGVNAVFTEAETYRDDLIEAAHHAGLSFIGGIACFSDHAHQNQVLEQRPELWPIDASGARRTPMSGTWESHRRSRITQPAAWRSPSSSSRSMRSTDSCWISSAGQFTGAGAPARRRPRARIFL